MSFRYEVTTGGQRLWAADVDTVANIESLIWRQYWDFRLKLEQDWEHFVGNRSAPHSDRYGYISVTGALQMYICLIRGRMDIRHHRAGGVNAYLS